MVKVNLVGFKQLQETIKKLPVELKKEVATNIRGAADQFRGLAIRDAPADVSNPGIRSGITVAEISELSFEVVSNSQHSAPMEFGTKTKFVPIPGIDSSEFKGQPKGGKWKQFIHNITNWAGRKGIDKKAVYPIARSIYKHGVKPHPFFFKQIGPVRRDLFRNIRNVLKTVTK